MRSAFGNLITFLTSENLFLATLATQGTMQQISKPRPANENIQPKQPTSRPLILPSNGANIRPASSVSTQTIGAQTPVSTVTDRPVEYYLCVGI